MNFMHASDARVQLLIIYYASVLVCSTL